MIEVAILTPQKEIFAGSVDEAIIPTKSGEIGILKGHAELFSVIVAGFLKLKKNNGVETFLAEQGFIHIIEDKISILVKSCMKVEQEN